MQTALSEQRLRCNFRIVFIILFVLFALALSGVVTGGIAKKEAEEEITPDDLTQDGVFVVYSPILTESITFDNQFTQDISDKRVGQEPFGISIRMEEETNFPTLDVESEDIHVTAYRIGDMISVYVSGWTGVCYNTTTRLSSKNTIPAEFVMYKNAIFSDSTNEKVSVQNDGVYKTGNAFISSNGNIVISANSNDPNELWNGACGCDPFTVNYIAYV